MVHQISKYMFLIYLQYIYIYTLSYILHLPALAGGFFTTSTTWEAPLKGKRRV